MLVLLGVVLVGLALGACGAEAEDSPVELAETILPAVVEQADTASSVVPSETDPAEPDPEAVETQSAPSEPRISAAERRAIEVAAILDQAAVPPIRSRIVPKSW